MEQLYQQSKAKSQPQSLAQSNLGALRAKGITITPATNNNLAPTALQANNIATTTPTTTASLAQVNIGALQANGITITPATNVAYTNNPSNSLMEPTPLREDMSGRSSASARDVSGRSSASARSNTSTLPPDVSALLEPTPLLMQEEDDDDPLLSRPMEEVDDDVDILLRMPMMDDSRK